MRALVIGAGVAGIVSALRLREDGVEVTVVEKADRLGGTWRENTYPGVACDVPSHLYSYSFAPNPRWSHTFAPGAEIQAYLESVAHETGVDDLIRYGVEIGDLTWKGDRWEATSTTGERFEAEVVVAATGVLHHPRLPDIDGVDDFEGPCFHSARWDHDVELAGRRVGIIGSGSTGVQIVSAIAGEVAELHLFQRTPQWVLPLPNDPISPEEQERFLADPGAMADRRRNLDALFTSMFANVVVDASSPVLEEIEARCRENLEQHVTDPVLREKLRPDYRAACKRLVMSPDYFESVARPNVRVVTEPIDCVVPAGVRTADGVDHHLDVLVLATGFRVDRFLRPMTVTGSNGVSLDEAWTERPSAYLGVSVPDFPNLFLINGPNGPVGNFSLIEVAELQVGYMMQLLAHMGASGAGAVSVTRAASDRFEEERVAAAANTVWVTGCRSWYLDDRGVPAAWPWPFDRFRESMAAPVLDHFELLT